MARREELGHPLGTVSPAAEPLAPLGDVGSPPVEAADFVLEVGCEELPPDDVQAALNQLRREVTRPAQRISKMSTCS